ncbi:LPXTG cell wall anchor domain-containing protein [Kitasatospora aburaviensis]
MPGGARHPQPAAAHPLDADHAAVAFPGGETTPGNPRTGGPSTAPTTPVSPSSQAVPAAAHTASPAAAAPEATGSQLASTGAGGTELLGAAGVALLVGGGVLYRRARAGVR